MNKKEIFEVVKTIFKTTGSVANIAIIVASCCVDAVALSIIVSAFKKQAARRKEQIANDTTESLEKDTRDEFSNDVN